MKVVLVDGGITFDIFESQIRLVNGSGSSPIIYSLKHETMSICAHIPWNTFMIYTKIT